MRFLVLTTFVLAALTLPQTGHAGRPSWGPCNLYQVTCAPEIEQVFIRSINATKCQADGGPLLWDNEKAALLEQNIQPLNRGQKPQDISCTIHGRDIRVEGRAVGEYAPHLELTIWEDGRKVVDKLSFQSVRHIEEGNLSQTRRVRHVNLRIFEDAGRRVMVTSADSRTGPNIVIDWFSIRSEGDFSRPKVIKLLQTKHLSWPESEPRYLSPQ